MMTGASTRILSPALAAQRRRKLDPSHSGIPDHYMNDLLRRVGLLTLEQLEQRLSSPPLLPFLLTIPMGGEPTSVPPLPPTPRPLHHHREAQDAWGTVAGTLEASSRRVAD